MLTMFNSSTLKGAPAHRRFGAGALFRQAGFAPLSFDPCDQPLPTKDETTERNAALVRDAQRIRDMWDERTARQNADEEQDDTFSQLLRFIAAESLTIS